MEATGSRGMIGALPWTAWAALLRLLSPVDDPDKAWRATVLELRRVCAALHALVGQHCVGGAGWLAVESVEQVGRLESAPTTGLGRALVVKAWTGMLLPSYLLSESEQLAVVEALAEAVRRGHMVWFRALPERSTPALMRAAEAVLVEASRRGQLLFVDLRHGVAHGWSSDAMAQLCVITLGQPEQGVVETIVEAGRVWRIELLATQWADVAILASLHEIRLASCRTVEDVSHLADVPRLALEWCPAIRTLPAMRNDWLEVVGCSSLIDVSSLARGRVGRLELWSMARVGDVSAIGAMQPPPRTVVLEGLSEVQDVSMLAGVHRLVVIDCHLLDKDMTLAALEGTVDVVHWVGQ